MPKSFKINKDVYDIPDNEVDSFLKDNPNAIEVQSFVVDKDTFDIPVSEVELFLKDMPNAKPLNTKGASSEGTPAPSANGGSGFMTQYVQGAKEALGKKPNTSGVIQETFEEAAAPTPEYKEVVENVKAKKQEIANDPFAKEVVKSRLQYERTKPIANAWQDKSGFRDASKAIAMGETNIAFDQADQDYLNSIQDENLRANEQSKLESIKAKPVSEQTDADKEFLFSIRNKALNGYAATKQARLYELNREFGLDDYINRSNNISTQFVNAKKQYEALKDDNTEAGRTKKLELEGVMQRLSEKNAALQQESGISQEVLDEAKGLYNDLSQIQNISDLNDLNADKAYKELKKEYFDQKKKQQGGLSNFMDALSGTVAKSALSVTQAPKILGDLFGDTDYDGFDKWYDKAQNTKTGVEEQIGRQKDFNNLPFFAKIPTYLGEGVGSVTVLAAGGAAAGGSDIGIVASAFLTSEADYYQQALDMGLNPKQAAQNASALAAITAWIEKVVPDTEYFDPKSVGRSVFKAMANGKTFQEASNLAIKELLPAIGEYASRTGIGAVKEGGEELLGGIGEAVTGNVLDTARGRNDYQTDWNSIVEQTVTGALTGGALSAAGRIVANRRSPVQESEIAEVSKHPELVNSIIANMPASEGKETLDLVDEAAKIRAAWMKIPSFTKLDENVQNHIVSEALRVKQLTSAARESGADKSTIAGAVDEANANILYAQSNNKIKGEKDVPSPTMEWEGEQVKTTTNDSENEQGAVPSSVGSGETVVEAQPNEGASKIAVSASGNVQGDEEIAQQEAQEEAALPTLTQEEETAHEAEFNAVVDEVKAAEPTLTEDEADHAAALVQDGASVEEAVAHVKEVAIDEFSKEITDEQTTDKDKIRNLATEYIDAMGDSKYTPKQKAIVDVGLLTTQDSFERFGDKNNITKGIAKSYFSKKGLSIDEIAQTASMESGLNIEPEDVIDLILDYPQGLKSRSQKAIEINNEYKKITGKNITTASAKSILSKNGNVSKTTESILNDSMNALDREGLLTQDGNLDLNRLSEMIDDEEFFTVFPLGLSKEEYQNLKQYVKESTNKEGENVLGLDDHSKESTQENKPSKTAQEGVEQTTTESVQSEGVNTNPDLNTAEATQTATKEENAKNAQSIFAAVDEEIATTDRREMAVARRNNKAKFGEAYNKAVRITKDFNKIVERLEKEGKITKECP